MQHYTQHVRRMPYISFVFVRSNVKNDVMSDVLTQNTTFSNAFMKVNDNKM